MPITPMFQDRYLALYRCTGCAPDAEVSWVLQRRGAATLIDVVTVVPAPVD